MSMHDVGSRRGPMMAPGARLTIGMVGTYPPTACGLATFGAALSEALRTVPGGPDVRVVQVTSEPLGVTRGEVVARLDSGAPGAAVRAARALDGLDAVIVQHEYGIYAGACGEEVLELLAALRPPAILIAHTVLREPSARQRSVLRAAAAASAQVVTMTTVARDRLVQRYGLDPRQVTVIPHGVRVASGRPPLSAGRPELLTWGLLGPGKGIEWAIDALARLRDLDPAPGYRVAGRTHPKVREREGEEYRRGLERRARERGVANLVTFDDRYPSADELQALVCDVDVVVLPYESTEQVTSGVLVDAVACGRPVVASAFPHAVELLSGGAGLVVPQRDPVALAAALRRVLTEPGLAAHMAAQAAALAPQLSWAAVAHRYLDLVEALRARRVA